MQRVFKLLSMILVWYFLILINPSYIFSADKQLYLLNGTPTPKSDALFPSSLYSVDLNKSSLIHVRNIISSDQGTDFIHQYPDERVIILRSIKSSRTEGDRSSDFAVVSMNSPKAGKSFSIIYPEVFLDIEGHLFDIPSKGLYQGIKIADADGVVKLLGINLLTMKQEELSWDVYKYVQLSGIPGGATSGGDWFSVYSRPDGKILIPNLSQRIESDWQLPESIKFRDNDRIVLFVNNDKILALSSVDTRVKKADGLGYSPFHIFNKKTSKWTSVQFKGGKSGVRGFGSWLAGYVADEERNVDSPGKEKRRPVSKFPRKEDMTKTGTPVDWRFKDFKIYVPGILFLYNADTQQKYEIETGQGDSEILLVEGDMVYYRVNDEIYKAQIGKNKVESGSLIVKDEIVPDIHWAFMGPQ